MLLQNCCVLQDVVLYIVRFACLVCGQINLWNSFLSPRHSIGFFLMSRVATRSQKWDELRTDGYGRIVNRDYHIIVCVKAGNVQLNAIRPSNCHLGFGCKFERIFHIWICFYYISLLIETTQNPEWGQRTHQLSITCVFIYFFDSCLPQFTRF